MTLQLEPKIIEGASAADNCGTGTFANAFKPSEWPELFRDLFEFYRAPRRK